MRLINRKLLIISAVMSIVDFIAFFSNLNFYFINDFAFFLGLLIETLRKREIIIL